MRVCARIDAAVEAEYAALLRLPNADERMLAAILAHPNVHASENAAETVRALVAPFSVEDKVVAYYTMIDKGCKRTTANECLVKAARG